MHVRRGQCHITKSGSFESIAVFFFLANAVTPSVFWRSVRRDKTKVVIFVVSKVGAVVAFGASSLANKDNQPALFLLCKGAFVSACITVKAGLRRDQRAFKGGNSMRHVIKRWPLIEHSLKILPVAGNGVQSVNKMFFIQHVHLCHGQKRTFALLVQRGGAAVPELCRVVCGIQDG